MFILRRNLFPSQFKMLKSAREGPMDAAVFLAEEEINQRLANAKCAKLGQFRALIRFAVECVRRTPIAGGVTPIDLLANRPVLLNAISVVEGSLNEKTARRVLTDQHELAERSARDAGPFVPTVTGPRAAEWATCSLCWAAAEVAAVEQDGRDLALANTARHVSDAARFARRSGPDGATLEATAFQRKLLDELLGGDGSINHLFPVQLEGGE
jgi:hypothetical protein